MTIALEHIQEGDWAAVNRVVDLLRSLVLDTGGQSLGIRVGTTTITFTASNASNTVTVSHGLGRTPVAVELTVNDKNCKAQCDPASKTSTTFAVTGKYDSAVTGPVGVDWVAIG